MRDSLFAAALGSVVSLVACAPLETLSENVCGNGAVEKGEDCEPGGPYGCIPPGDRYECRIRCDGATNTGCPSGMVCGAGDRCIAHSGSFALSDAVDVGVDSSLLVGDFDGDGAKDVVAAGSGQLAVLHVAPTGQLAAPVALHATDALPAVARLTADASGAVDALDDLVSAYGGLFVNRGNAGRTYPPVTYAPISSPSGAVPPTFSTLDLFPPYQADMPMGEAPVVLGLGDELVATTDSSVWYLDELTLQWVAGSEQQGGMPRFDDAALVADVVQRPAAEDCDEIVDADEATPWQLRSLSPCGSSFDPATPFHLVTLPGAMVTMPRNCHPDRGIVTADVNGDGFVDAVVASSCGAPPGFVAAAEMCADQGAVPAETTGGSLWVAYGQPYAPTPGSAFLGQDPLDSGSPAAEGDCNVIAVPNADLQQILSEVARVVAGADAGARLLFGAADLNADGLVDFVLGDGTVALSLTDPSGSGGMGDAGYLPIPYGESDLWDFAFVADFNGNGVPDVVAGSSKVPELVMLNGSQGSIPKRLRVPLAAPPVHPAVGDFDGDLLPDVAFAERAEEGATDMLAICFGQPFGALAAPHRIGQLGEVTQTITGNLPIGGLDGIDDLIVTWETTDGESLGLSLLLGSSDRLLFSPLFFTQAELDGEMGPTGSYEVDAGFLASSVARGELDGQPDGHEDVAVLTRPGRREGTGWDYLSDHYVWLLPTRRDAAILPSDVRRTGLDGGDGVLYTQPEPLLDRALVMTMDLGGPATTAGMPVDELVLLAPERAPGTGTALHGRVVVLAVMPEGADDPTTPEHDELRSGRGLSVAQSLEIPGFVFGAPARAAGDWDPLGALEWASGGRAQAGDIDGDEDEDLVVLALRTDGTPTVVALRSHASPDLGAAFAPGDLVELSAGLSETVSGTVTDFALWQADSESLDPALELLLLTTDGVYLVDLAPATGSPTSVTQIETTGGSSHAPGGMSVAVGDFDGDRLDDLAIARPYEGGSVFGSLEILLGLPRTD